MGFKEWTAIVKGLATYVGPLNWYRKRGKCGGNTEDAAYCYSVWLRHVCTMRKFGWHPAGKKVCELGPGNSIGLGIAALFGGVESYTGLDAWPYPFATNKDRLVLLIKRMSELYSGKKPIPGPAQFPQLRPELDQYEFPSWLFAGSELRLHTAKIAEDLIKGVEDECFSPFLNYLAPYENLDLSSHFGLFDAILSQAVLEHVRDLSGSYRLMFSLLKPRGWSWHVVDFRCHDLASEWNGHWRYPEWLWKIVLGRREFLLNRMPLSRHIEFASQAGFSVHGIFAYKAEEDLCLASGCGLGPESFAYPFNRISREDAATLGCMLILQKP